jgi:hypothetical protein
MTSMENEGSSTHTGGGPGGFEKPGSHMQALTFALPSPRVQEFAGHLAQLAFARFSLKKPGRHCSHFSPSVPITVWFSKPGRHTQCSALLAFRYPKVLEPCGHAVQFRLAGER